MGHSFGQDEPVAAAKRCFTESPRRSTWDGGAPAIVSVLTEDRLLWSSDEREESDGGEGWGGADVARERWSELLVRQLVLKGRIGVSSALRRTLKREPLSNFFPKNRRSRRLKECASPFFPREILIEQKFVGPFQRLPFEFLLL